MVVAALRPLRRSALDPVRRGELAAAMVRAFSPWALASFGTLAVFGLITAWRHLKRLDALWTTPYGYALIVKLCVVGVVLALGAWNWKRQIPKLGTEAGALELEKSATAELWVAFVVLMVTAILVSLPSPK
jgi:copper transport protein